MIIEITMEERDELLRLVDNYFQETRSEVHHTQTREYRDQLLREESILRALHEKLLNGEQPSSRQIA